MMALAPASVAYAAQSLREQWGTCAAITVVVGPMSSPTAHLGAFLSIAINSVYDGYLKGIFGIYIPDSREKLQSMNLLFFFFQEHFPLQLSSDRQRSTMTAHWSSFPRHTSTDSHHEELGEEGGCDGGKDHGHGGGV